MEPPQARVMKIVTEMPQYSYLVDKIRSLKAEHKRPLLVALDGRSGVGKTTLAQTIAQDSEAQVRA
jgi:pantothenate kinase-related protein Tda10